MKKIILILFFLSFFIFYSIVKIEAKTTLSFIANEETNVTKLAEGVKYSTFSATSTSLSGVTGKQLVNKAVVDSKSEAKVVTWALADKSSDGILKSTVLKIAQDYEQNHPNMMVVAAVNGDYFGTTNYVNSTRNPLVIDGMVMNASPDSTAKARLTWMAINEDLSLNDDGNPYKLSERGESLTLSESYTMDIYGKNGGCVVKSVILDGINTEPCENGTSLYIKTAYEPNDGDHIYKLNYPVSHNITKKVCYTDTCGDVYFAAGTANVYEKFSLESTETGIVTKDKTLIDYFKLACKVKIYKTVTGEYKGYNSIFGVPQQILKDKEIVNNEDIINYGSHRDAARSRTSIGFKEDGSCVLLTFDEKVASGLSLAESAAALKNEGCVSGFNLDGGGSTTFVARLNGSLRVVNNPSDGAPRSVGNAILVVVPKTEIKVDVKEQYACENVNYITLATEVTKLQDFEYENIYYSVDGKRVENHFMVDATKEHVISVDLVVDGLARSYAHFTYTPTKLSKVDYPKKPTIEVTEAKDGGLDVEVVFKDPYNLIYSLELKINSKRVTLPRNENGKFVYHIDRTLSNTFYFEVSYLIPVALDETDEITVQKSYEYKTLNPTDISFDFFETIDHSFELYLSYNPNGCIIHNIYIVINGELIEYKEKMKISNEDLNGRALRVLFKYSDNKIENIELDSTSIFYCYHMYETIESAETPQNFVFHMQKLKSGDYKCSLEYNANNTTVKEIKIANIGEVINYNGNFKAKEIKDCEIQVIFIDSYGYERKMFVENYEVEKIEKVEKCAKKEASLVAFLTLFEIFGYVVLLKKKEY